MICTAQQPALDMWGKKWIKLTRSPTNVQKQTFHLSCYLKTRNEVNHITDKKTQYKLCLCYMLFGVTILLLKHLWKLQMKWYTMGKYTYMSVKWSKWTYSIMQEARLMSKQKACLSSWVAESFKYAFFFMTQVY
jgi:hypothetical protein